jgi:hypothetical protein
MGKKIISVDFDGTIVGHDFPDIGEPLPGAIETLKAFKAAGWKLILWTCRENEKKRAYLDEAVEFCRSHGVEFDAVNEPHYETDFRDHRPLRKPYFTYSIDDRNVGGMMDWDLIRRIILEGEEVKIVPVADSTKA